MTRQMLINFNPQDDERCGECRGNTRYYGGGNECRMTTRAEGVYPDGLMGRPVWFRGPECIRREKLMRDLIATLPKDHYECEDGFYSCPAHPDYFGGGRIGVCDCGYDAQQAALAAIKGETG